jgi:hypothetical protein
MASKREKAPPKALDVRAACRRASTRAVEVLTELLESDEPAVALRAAGTILTRAWGSPGSEADVRQTDTARVLDARERKTPGGHLLRLLDNEKPPPVVDGPAVGDSE